MKRLISLTLALLLVLQVSGCSKTATVSSGDITEPSSSDTSVIPVTEPAVSSGTDTSDTKTVNISAEEASLSSDLSWQYDVIFPEWQDRAMYAANNRLGFFGYSGQGKIYICQRNGASGYSIYVNDRKIDTSSFDDGVTYAVNISDITRDGNNSLQVSGISQGEVEVKIPYPTVIEGIPSDVGISSDALRLIEEIISSDVENGFPSAQLAIVRNGRLVYEKAFGNVRTYDENGANIDSTPVTTDTLYDLASVTKMFSVNYALQYLITNGKLTLDTRIIDILGEGFAGNTIDIEYEGYPHIPLETNIRWKSGLRIRDLLMHQGGFPAGPQYFNDRYDNASQSFGSDNGNILYVSTSGDGSAREETLKQISRTPLMYEPGTRSLYSDVDYMILCYCVERITGQRIDEFLKETFFEPMGLTHITYNPLANGFDKEDCAATELMGNSRDGNVAYTGIRTDTIRGEVHDPNAYYCMGGISGHAGLFANASDLAVLASVMLSGGYGNNRFFSRDVIDAFTSIQDLSSPEYGLGWQREGDHERDYFFGSAGSSNIYGHQGFTGTLVAIDPANNMVMVILTNKIHSRILSGDPALSTYYGSLYTTGSLGFFPEILEMGLDHEADSGIWADMADDIASEILKNINSRGITDREHPRWKAYDAMTKAASKMRDIS